MTHYKMLEKDPSALITTNGSEPKIYQGNVIYLNNGDNFEVRLFNPLQKTIGAEIILNNQKRNDGLIVLKPGQKITLDRFIGESRKMLFETYKIDGGDADAVKAAELNGLVEINFYDEDIQPISWTTNSMWVTNTGNPNPYSTLTNCGGMGTVYTSNISSNITLTGGVSTGTSSSNVKLSKSVKGKKDPNYKFSTRSFNSPGIFTQDMDFSSQCCADFSSEYKTLNEPETELETGRIEKGEASAQQLKEVDVKFKSFAFHTVRFQLKPVSTIPVTMKEVRHYCPECGYRMRKSSWKFCPQCGEKI